MLVSDYRWQVLANARSALLDAFRHEGVITVQYVAAYPHQAQFAVWLGTATDAEAETLRRSEIMHGRTRDLLVEHGFSEQDLAELLVVVQSQETVDRAWAVLAARSLSLLLSSDLARPDHLNPRPGRHQPPPLVMAGALRSR